MDNHSSTDGPLGCFHSRTIVNSAVMTFIFGSMFVFISLEWNCSVIGTSTQPFKELFSKVAVSFNNSTSNI